MREPGERPRQGRLSPMVPARGSQHRPRSTPRSIALAVLLAFAAALGAASAWAIMRGLLELGPGSLVVAALGGWAIGAAVRLAHGPPLLAALLASAAWLAGLLLTWLLAMAILPGSTRTFAERVAGTPFLDWLSPQLGVLEAAALLLYMGVAAWTASHTAGGLQ